MTKSMPKFEKLRNGATVLHQHTAPSGYTYALCRWTQNSDRQYVSWTIDDTGNAYNGHYWETIEAAVNDYEQRAGVVLDKPLEAPLVVAECLKEMRELMQGEKCDHDAGICYCSTFQAMDTAEDFLLEQGFGDLVE